MSLVAACLAGGATAARAEIIERIVAVVNDDVILKSELNLRIVAAEEELDQLSDPAQIAARRAQISEALVDTMIAEQLIAQQATELKLHVTGQEVDKALEEVRRQNKVTAEQLEQALRQEGFTMAQYRSDVKRQILRLKVINVAVRSRISISDEDVKEHYDRTLRQSGAVKEVRAAHIFVEIPENADDAVIKDRMDRAAELTQRARAGEDFAKLAKETSEDPATKDDGGDLGWLGRGMLPKQLDEVVFAMKAGEIRGPLKGETGFHVIKVIETRAGEVQPFEKVKEKLREQLYQTELKRQTRIWLDELKRKAYVKKRLTPSKTSSPAKDAVGGGSAAPKSPGGGSGAGGGGDEEPSGGGDAPPENP